ncbi:acetolactate synthase 2 catalytic subunit [Agarivorans sp. 1_MG-2023]|uniref:acetolactate synthase 2 catalytic subunit n=1 Tax=Agarivorans sp. 1_MG-2023 TaxID=3062634 RepID=UPI0026E457C6|nr:acetolactate synthase 2 catalytic subunit [Agarivorans sp. 1_MG-2023]MDO6763387.1 acetolactate synthase 2 catalytic subunit [Agarivorans sp. 1_MG-2023]
MNGAQQIVATLKQQGVEQVFGYPGGAIMPLYDALYDGGVKHMLTRHEQGAAMAAVGYARAGANRGLKVGVCIATSGPGATNLVTGLAEAQLDSIPLIAITGQVAQPVIGTDAFQEVDVLGMSLSVTKHSFMVTDVKELKRTIEQAFEIATSGRPGPVLIDVPKDVQLAEVEESLAYVASTQPATAPNASSLAQAKRLIAEAKQPMAYVGGGVGMANAVSELRAFLTDSQIPSVSTLKGIGSITEDQPYYLGMLGMHGTKAANLSVQETDLLIVIGARFDDRVTGKLDEFAPDAKVIHLDADASEFGKRREPDVALDSDLKLTLPELHGKCDIAPWQATVSQRKHDFAWRYDHPGAHIFAPAMLNELSKMIDKDTVVACDVGQHQMWVAQHMQFDGPENHLSSAGLGTMGFGLPAAIGAQFARPNDTVINVSGDGSFMMNVQELTTIKRAKLPVKMLLIDNNRLGMVRQWQDLFFNGRFSETILDDNPDFVKMASAFDIPGETISNKIDVHAALQRMLNSDGPYLLHVLIDAEENVWPLVPPGVANDKMMEDC